MAAVDGFGNVGPTSSPSCATPMVDAGTFDAASEDDDDNPDAAFRADAGSVDAAQNEPPGTERAGCLCSQGVPGSPTGAYPSALAAVAITSALARRRRRRGCRPGQLPR